jgi:hypothetical protein
VVDAPGPAAEGARANDPGNEAQIAEHEAALKALGRRQVGDVLQSGWHYNQIRALKGYKPEGFLEWFKEKKPEYSLSTVERWMRAATAFEGKFVTVTNLPIDLMAIYVLSERGVPLSARDKAIEIAISGIRVDKRLAKAIIDRIVPPRLDGLGFFEDDDWQEVTDQVDPFDIGFGDLDRVEAARKARDAGEPPPG